jgi:hypothetical protein
MKPCRRNTNHLAGSRCSSSLQIYYPIRSIHDGSYGQQGKLYKGKEPHGSLLTTYVNETAHRSARKNRNDRRGNYRKENYTSDKKTGGSYVMYKIKGYNPANNDWFWARFASDGKTEASGKADACIKCHINKKENDYIFSGPLR